MNPTIELPAWAALITAALVLVGAAVTLIGSFGLLRLDSFYQRAHAPTLGSTLGIGCILLASMIFFSVAQSRPVLHEILIAVFAFVTTPITLLLLVRAALYRYRSENAPGIPALDYSFMDDTTAPTSDAPPTGPDPEASA